MAAAKTRYLYLDGARLVAALGVTAYHVRNAPRIDGINIINLHYTIVDFFFVLSGFVLCPTLKRLQVADAQTKPVSNFLWKRFVRLWPFSFLVLTATLAFVSVLVAYERIAGTQGADSVLADRPLLGWPIALLFLQIFSHAAWAWCVPLWSLSALWWATVVTVVASRHQRVRFDVVLLLVGTVTEIACLVHDGQASDAAYGPTGFSRALIGMNLGLIVRRIMIERTLPNRWFLSIVALAAFSGLLVADSHAHLLALVMAPWVMVTAVLILAGMNTDALSSRKAAFLSEMGKYSFPLFIWHVLVLQIYGDVLLLTKVPETSILSSFQVTYVIVATSTLAVAAVSMRKLEPPISRVLSRIGEKYLPFVQTSESVRASQ